VLSVLFRFRDSDYSFGIFKLFPETDIINMLGFLIDNMLCLLDVFCNRQSALADLFLYLYEADFIQGLLTKNEKKLALSFNSTFCYIDDVLSISNYKFGDVVDHLYPVEIEIKDTIETAMSASYIAL